MKTVRAIIAGALTRWIEQADEKDPCQMVKLVHILADRNHMPKLDSWRTPKGINIGLLTTQIEETARNDATNAGDGGIVEKYGIMPYFGNELAEGALCRFSIASAISEDNPEVSAAGQYTEGATPRGAQHQTMRHMEALARMYIEGHQVTLSSLSQQNRELYQQNTALVRLNSDMRNEVEEAKDRGVERQLAVYRVYEEEKRSTKLMEGLFAAAPGLINMALGRPILPENTDDQGVNLVKNWVRALTIKDMEALQSLGQQKYMPILLMKTQVTEEDELEEKRKQAAAQKEVQGIMQNEAVIETMAKRDAAGLQRDPLGGT